MRSSDSLRVICLPCLFSLSGILESSVIGLSRSIKNLWDLTGCLADMMCTREWAFDSGSPITTRHDAAADVAFQACTDLGQDPTGTKISELNTIHGRAATPSPFILTTFLCTLQRATSATTPYTCCNTRYWASG